MKFKLLCALVLGSTALCGMQKLSFKDLSVVHTTTEKEISPDGMTINCNTIVFHIKATNQYVGCLGYDVFDTTGSRNRESDRELMAALMFFDSCRAHPYVARTLNTLDELARDSYAFLFKQRKPGDITYGFKTYVAPCMGERSQAIRVSFLSIMRDYQMAGLGQQIMLYFLQHLCQHHPDSMVCWIAHVFNKNPKKNSMTDKDLEALYKKWGGTVAQDGSGFCYVDVAKLDLGIFKVQPQPLKTKFSGHDTLQSKL